MVAKLLFRCKNNPLSSEVLTNHLKKRNLPEWTSYFVRRRDVKDDQFGLSHFNWQVDENNYHILRTGCFPYIKYHCSKRKYEDLHFEDSFFKILKILNLGIPMVAYGIGASLLIRHSEIVPTEKGNVKIFFLYEEDKGAMY